MTRSLGKIFYVSLTLLFSGILCSFNLAISAILSNWLTFSFVNKLNSYLLSINDLYHGILSLDLMISKLSIPPAFAWSIQTPFVSFGIISIIFFIIFCTFYRLATKNPRFHMEITNLSFIGPTAFVLFATLAFSVSLAFYFSLDFIDSNIRQTTVLMIGELDKTTQALKQGLLSSYMLHEILKYEDESLYQIFFFGIFIMLMAGIALSKKSHFFSQGFFIASVLSIIMWFSLFGTKFLSQSNPLY